jgi:uncharacterized protein YjbI with pentapeptide repeats
METLTLFIDHLYTENFGTSEFQMIVNRSFISLNYKDLTISGNLCKEVVFEDVIFENCTFLGTTMENCLFINCIFINCKFQFSKFINCNFELISWENCTWGFSYECGQTRTQLNEFISLCA